MHKYVYICAYTHTYPYMHREVVFGTKVWSNQVPFRIHMPFISLIFN